ncbi:hypothetical protein BJ742DRAFT_675548 [Cladochytrium replicatum]|nr:hypothetical protein BJ742DRAFT_675548 [Cladochytrium replicatum]
MDERRNSIPTILEDGEFDSYSDQELSKLLEMLIRTNRVLEQECILFESYLHRVNPQAVRGDNPDFAGESAFSNLTRTSDGSGFADTTTSERKENRREERKKKKGEKAKEADKPILLTPEQKSEIATRELEELRDEIEKQKEDWGKTMDNVKAEMEEVEIRVSEVKKALYEFKRDIVQQAVNRRTGRVIAERLLRYYEDKIRSKDAVIEKVRLKNATLKVQKNKLHLQLKQKEEMGEVLHAIDFDQLQIENKQYLSKIEERNAELLKLKMTAGKTVQILNHYKKKLQSLSQESDTLQCEIIQRRELLSKLNGIAEIVAVEKAEAEKLNHHLREQMENFRVPVVMDYVHVKKAHQHELARKVKSWERKVEIASMQAQR